MDSTQEKFLYDETTGYELRALEPTEINSQTQTLFHTDLQVTDRLSLQDSQASNNSEDLLNNIEENSTGHSGSENGSQYGDGEEESKKEKSLGIMCQKFIMLFLIGNRVIFSYF